jgi:hypothetical protein
MKTMAMLIGYSFVLAWKSALASDSVAQHGVTGPPLKYPSA